jgi:hypothetical protein
MNTSLIAVPFHGKSLSAVLVDNIPYVAMKTICENIGIDWDSQRHRIQRHPVLKSTTVMITAVAQDGKLREMLMMPIKYLNGWLFGIDSNRVKPEIKNRVIEYQEECFDVLANHFMPKVEAQYGLKPLPPSAINDAEYKTLTNAIKASCFVGGVFSKSKYSIRLNELTTAYGKRKLEFLPTGKVPEMLAFLGLRVPELDEMVLVPQRQLLALEEKAKRVQGELVNESKNNTVTIELVPLKQGEMKRYMITHHGSDLVMNWAVTEDSHRTYCIDVLIKADYLVIEMAKIRAMPAQQLGVLLA